MREIEDELCVEKRRMAEFEYKQQQILQQQLIHQQQVQHQHSQQYHHQHHHQQQQQQQQNQQTQEVLHVSTCEHEPIVRKRESEIEHHKITRTEPFKRSQEETLSLTASLYLRDGDKQSEKSVWTSKTSSGCSPNSTTTTLLKNEIIIPICEEQLTPSQQQQLHTITNTAAVTVSPMPSPHIRSEIATSTTGAANSTVIQVSSTIDSAGTTESSEQRVYKDGELISEKTLIER